MSEPRRVMEGRRLLLIVATVAANIVALIVGAVFGLGWLPAMLYALAVDLVLVIAVFAWRDGILGRLFVMGCLTSVLELTLADASFVRRGILVYAPGGPFVVESPLYMPLMWVFLVVQFGGLMRWVMERWGLVVAFVAGAVAGGTGGPLYELLAERAGLWEYHDCWRIFGVPVFLVPAEALLTVGFALGVVRLPKLSWLQTVLIGTGFGLLTWASGWLCFALLQQRP